MSLEYLIAMEDSNPHGAGVAWLAESPSGPAIRFMKGLTAKDIHQLQSDGVMTYPYLMHYRWATHGDKIPELTHPFPIGPRALLGELSGYAQSVLIHNGTWGSYEKEAGKYLNQGNYELPEEMVRAASDTAVAAWLAQDNPDILDEVMWATAVATIIDGVDEDGNSKKTMEIVTRGTWSDQDGNWYSNLNWLPWNGYMSFPGTSVYTSSSKYEDWAKAYYDDDKWGKEPAAVDGPVATSDIDWDKYFLAPFGSREEKDRHLNFDQYVERFRRPKADVPVIPANQTGRKPSNEMSWDDYLVAKYGAEVAAQIKSDCFPEENSGGGGESVPLSLSCGYSAGNVDEWSPDHDPEAETYDPDTISEDWETVNAILERQMRSKWANG